jgi:acyl-CoA thioester hydrolase
MGQAFTHRIRVRYAECDPQGVVFNTRYYEYYDLLMTELWRDLGGYDAMVEAGVDMSVVQSGARFLAPARFDDELDLTARIARLGTTAMTTEITIANASTGQHLVEGEISHVFIDPTAYTKVPIPEHVRAGLEPYLKTPDPAEAPA